MRMKMRLSSHSRMIGGDGDDGGAGGGDDLDQPVELQRRL